MGYQIKIPSCVYAGVGSIEEIGTILKQESSKKALVFTDKGVAGAGLLDKLTAVLERTGVEYKVFDGLNPEPAYTDVEKVVEQMNREDGDIIIAIGGGSVMDAAKLCSLLKGSSCTVTDLLTDPLLASKQMKTIMIPTTCGTGSEATCNAIVAIPEEQSKKGIVNAEMIPDYVILDAQMIAGLPASIVAATGVDALAHVVECFTSNKANPISDTYALEALDMILNNILPACDDPTAMAQKSAMQLASFYAGVAITASGTTAVHALSYPLGGKYHIAHGVSNAILLAPVMRFNAPACEGRLAAAYDRCVHGEASCATAGEKAEYMLQWLERIVRHLDIPTSLQEFGVPAADLDVLVEAGMQVTRLLVNNPRPVTADDARALYRQIL